MYAPIYMIGVLVVGCEP